MMMKWIQGLFGMVHCNAYIKAMMYLVLTASASVSTFAANGARKSSSIEIVQQKTVTVKGIVKDVNGKPIIGASVVEKGLPSNGTVSDINGRFSISVKHKELIISYIGYSTKTIAVKGATADITLEEDTNVLDEMVVVGYGSQKKATLTGSVSQMSGDDIKKMAAVNITNVLAGKTAGVIANMRTSEPGEDDASILIRGKGTLGDTSPLIVVDGVADRSFSRLNPDDIESISVLKDASAAIYGSRAANGVILVTTRRGKEGKTKVSYNGNVSFSQPTRIPKMLNAYQYATYVDEFDASMGNTLTYPETAIQKIKDGNDLISFPNTNWWDAVTKDWATNTQHSVSVSGGGDKILYYLSAQYMSQDVIYKVSPQNYKQYQFTSNIDAKLTKAIRLSLDIRGREEDRDRGIYSTEDMFGYFLTTNPMSAPYFPNGMLRIGYDGITNNALLMASDIPGTDNTTNYILNMKPKVHVDLDIVTPGLYVEGYAALDYYFNNGKTIKNPYDIYSYDSETGKYVNHRDATGAISVNSWSNNSNRITLNARIGYTHLFNNTHRVDAFVSYEQSKYKYNSLSAYRTNYISSALPEIDFGSQVDADKDNGGSSDETARQNWFGRVNYGYKDKYLAEFTLRYDGSMNFAKGHRWGLFPSMSLGWVISQEKFFESLTNAVNFLKIKASYGLMGNDNITSYQYLSMYSFSSSSYAFGTTPSYVQGIYETRTANPLVTWEKSHSYNVGFSAQFLKGMFGLDFDYFYTRRNDILLTRNASVPTYSGLSLPAENLGKVKNSGFELVASYKDKSCDFSWGATGNITYAKNKVIYMDEAAKTPEWQKNTGHSIDGMTLYKALGIYQTQEEIDASPHLSGTKVGDLIYQDTNGDKKITWDDAIRIDKSTTPRWMFGLTLNGAWKGIDAVVFFQGQADAQQYVAPTMNMATDFYEGRWIESNTKEENASAKWPRAFMSNSQVDGRNSQSSTWWLRDASFVRLKSLEIGYTFPLSLIKIIGLSNLRVYINASNLFTIDSMGIFDPEMTSGIKGYPINRTLTFGLNLSF